MTQIGDNEPADGDVPRVIPPWSDSGWYGQETRKRLDPELRALILSAGLGKVNPIGYFPGMPAAVWSGAAHNPYTAILVGTIALATGIFMFVQMIAVLWAAIAAGGVFFALGLMIVVPSVRRVPSWHRARKLVRDFVVETGRPYPKELRWNA